MPQQDKGQGQDSRLVKWKFSIELSREPEDFPITYSSEGKISRPYRLEKEYLIPSKGKLVEPIIPNIQNQEGIAKVHLLYICAPSIDFSDYSYKNKISILVNSTGSSMPGAGSGSSDCQYPAGSSSKLLQQPFKPPHYGQHTPPQPISPDEPKQKQSKSEPPYYWPSNAKEGKGMPTHEGSGIGTGQQIRICMSNDIFLVGDSIVNILGDLSKPVTFENDLPQEAILNVVVAYEYV
jgi:hypothetical protein